MSTGWAEPEQKSNLAEVYKGVITLLDRRGYEVTEDLQITEDDGFNFNYLKEIYAAQVRANPNQQVAILSNELKQLSLRKLLTKTFHRDDPKSTLLVYFAEIYDTKSISVNEINVLGTILLSDPSINDVLIVGSADLAYHARNRINEIKTDTFRVQFFKEEELMYDPTYNAFSNKFQVLTEEEKKEYMNSNSVRRSEFPQALTNDPIAKYMGLQPGTLVRFQHEVPVEGMLVDMNIFYRVIREGSAEKIRKAQAKKARKLLGYLD